MAETQEIGCTCRCRIGLEVVQPESIGLQLEQFHIGFEDIPTLVISGSSLAIKQYYNIDAACEMPSASDAAILAECEAQWLNPSAPTVPRELIKTLQVPLSGDSLEQILGIPNVYEFYSASSTQITNELTARWSV